MTSEDAEATLKQARALMQQGRFADAIAAADTVLAGDPAHRDALYMKAVSQRFRKQFDDALDTLAKLRAAAPTYGRGLQELAHTYRDIGETAHAITAYAEAVRLNPALTASWKHLADLQAASGNADAARLAREQADRLAALPRGLSAAASLIHEGRIGKAEQLVRAHLQASPKDVEGMRLLADIGMRLHVLDDAEFLLETALEFAPDHDGVRLDYVGVLHKRQKFEKALEQAQRLRERHPGHPIHESAYAGEAMAVGRFEEAIGIYDRLIAETPASPQLHLVRGHALKTIGREADAIGAYRAAWQAKPDFGDAFWSLANLKTYRFPEDEIIRMEAGEASPATGLEDRYHLCFALGKAHEDAGRYEASFAYYERGNALKKAELRYDADRTDAEFARQKAVCTPALFERKAGLGHPAPDPIFIVGLPRAGSTLIEQILASHSQVDGTLELPNILALAHRLNGRRQLDEAPRYPANLAELDAEKLRAFGETYIRETQVYRSGAPFFTDKMPNNFRHLGLIQLILPNAKIIDARRDPMACCFSGFKQLFAEGQEFTYGLEEIGRYYRGYVDLMDHWDTVLPGRILRVQHENVVADLETEVHRILEHCGLPFEAACVEFHKTERAVRTASAQQVRQPISDAGLERWKAFEPWLDPLKRALGPELSEVD